MSNTVDPIELDVSEPLKRAARRLVLNKYLVDKAIKEFGGDMLGGDLYDGAYGPHEPIPFLSRVVPFFFMRTLGSKRRPALVPASNTVGCSWRTSMSTFDDKDVPSTVQYFTNVESLLDGSLNKVSYAWIRELGLVAPLEGKNRVDFLRGQGVKFIPANVRECHYIAADRVHLYSFGAGALTTTWAVLDGRWVERVEHPSWTIPLMEAYSVVTHTAWPSDYPAPAEVIQAFLGREGVTTALGHPDHPGHPVVDLETLKAISSYRATAVLSRLVHLNQVRVNPRLWVSCGALMLIGAVAIGFAPTSWINIRQAAAFVLGAGLTAALLPVLVPIVVTQRQHVEPEIHLPLELAPKRDGRR